MGKAATQHLVPSVNRPRIRVWTSSCGCWLALTGWGSLCGWFLRAFWVRFGIGNTRAATSRVVGPWEALTSRALRFVRRRRAISLAFSNLRESSLRQSVQSRPNLRRRATLAGSATPRSSTSSEITPLREGPALQHGPNRRGAQQHGDH